MAKAKKQEKSIEQRLEEALVLYEKTPYELPSNWCWTKLPCITQIKTGKRDANHAKEGGQYRFYTCSAEYSMADTYAFEGESIIVPGNGDIGLVFYYDGKFEAYQRTYVINGFKGQTKYLYYYFYYKWREKNTYKQFGTAIPYVRMANFEEFEIPLAPLEEQKRIVEIIEKQFAKLDEARDLIQKSLDSFADRKSAILHKAFTGELTKKWREGKGVYRTTNEMPLGDYLFPMETKKPKKEEEYFDYIDIDSIDNKQQRVVEPKKILVKEAPSRAARGLKEDDIVFSMVRPYLRNIAYITKNLSHCIASTGFYVCRCKNGLNPHYLFYYLCNQELLDYLTEHFMRGDNSPSIRKDDLLGLKLVIPSTEEQEEIVRILDSIFEKEDKSKELLDMLDKIDEMKKSILARAFRGELGTSNPTDEPATDLLRKILK